jgi:hypothetical protein
LWALELRGIKRLLSHGDSRLWGSKWIKLLKEMLDAFGIDHSDGTHMKRRRISDSESPSPGVGSYKSKCASRKEGIVVVNNVND